MVRTLDYLQEFFMIEFQFDLKAMPFDEVENFFSCPNCGIYLKGDHIQIIRWHEDGQRLHCELYIHEETTVWRPRLVEFFELLSMSA